MGKCETNIIGEWGKLNIILLLWGKSVTKEKKVYSKITEQKYWLRRIIIYKYKKWRICRFIKKNFKDFNSERLTCIYDLKCSTNNR